MVDHDVQGKVCYVIVVRDHRDHGVYRVQG